MEILALVIGILLLALGFYLGWIIRDLYIVNSDFKESEEPEEHKISDDEWITPYHRRYCQDPRDECLDPNTQYLNIKNGPQLKFVNGCLVWDHIPEEKRAAAMEEYRLWFEKCAYYWSEENQKYRSDENTGSI